MNEQDIEYTRSDEINLPHQRFDIVAKEPFYSYPDDMIQFLMGDKDFEFIEHVDTNLTNVDVRNMDILTKIQLDGYPVLIHCEIQTDDSVNPSMVQRNVGYIGRCFERYGLPIYSYVIYLRSTAGRNDLGGYFQNVTGHRFIVEYQIIRLNEIDGEAILQSRQPALMPFTPLMKPKDGISSLEWTTLCVEVTKELSVDIKTKNNFLVELWVMSGLRHERQNLIETLSEDILDNSSVYEMIIERGMEQGIEQSKQQGAKEGIIESIVVLLDKRFEINTTPVLSPLLESIDDLQQVKQLFQEAIDVEHLEDFIRSIQNTQNGT